MKTKAIIVTVVLLLSVVLLPKNDSRIISDAILNIINPIKKRYQNFTKNIQDKSNSYLFQKESIKRLGSENSILRKQLLEQMHYIEEIKNIYTILPDLSTVPVKNIDIVETISYTKLNSYSQIILTKPEKLKEDKIYGLIQDKVVAGTAKLYQNQLIGSLISHTKCRFSVILGNKKAPGIALGLEKDKMIVKFIPKWYKVKVGDEVFTSGLDNIFFANIPVGVITDVEVQSSYSIAYLKTHADTIHPKAFFMINDSTPTLADNFDSFRTQFKPKPVALSIVIPPTQEQNTSLNTTIDQTQEDVVEPNTPVEVEAPKIVKKIKRYKKRKRKRKVIKKNKPKPSSLDLF
jgi:rod shape-determining protein MreC